MALLDYLIYVYVIVFFIGLFGLSDDINALLGKD